MLPVSNSFTPLKNVSVDIHFSFVFVWFSSRLEMPPLPPHTHENRIIKSEYLHFLPQNRWGYQVYPWNVPIYTFIHLIGLLVFLKLCWYNTFKKMAFYCDLSTMKLRKFFLYFFSIFFKILQCTFKCFSSFECIELFHISLSDVNFHFQ